MTTNFDPNKVLLTGENPFIRLADGPGASVTTDASFWRVILSPKGPGHVLFITSELKIPVGKRHGSQRSLRSPPR